jgi:hypothetical protein
VASFGKFDFALVANQKGNPQKFLQLANLPAQRGLCHVEMQCGFVEVQVLGDSDEVTYVTQFHGENSIPFSANTQ